MLIDLINQVKSVNALAPTNLIASVQGTYQDFSNCKISTGAIVDVGNYGSNTTNLQVQIEESSLTNSGFVAIPNMTVSGIAGSGHTVVRGQRTHRYLRANAISVQGATPSVYCSVEVIAELEYAGSGGGYSRSPSS